jgi:hypothetical protein
MINSSELITILEAEIKFYNGLSNNDWTEDKNEGFKLGIKYCKDLIEKLNLDEEQYMRETLTELGIDLNKPKKKSKLPRNKLGLSYFPKGMAGKDMLTMYREKHGLI